MEKRSVLLISTLRGYIESMGGTLKLVVEFSDWAPVQNGSIGNLTDTRSSKS